MSIYLYGIIPARLPQVAQPASLGVGDPPRAVRIAPHRALAAVVGDVAMEDVSTDDLRLLRRNMKAHAAVLNALVAHVGVLPVRFGVVFPDEQALVATILEPRQAILKQYLDELDGAVEVTLKATYIEDRILAQVVREQPQLVAQGRAASRGSYQARLESGRRIAAGIAARRDQEAQWLVDRLRKVAGAVRINPAPSDLMALNGSFLIDRAKMPAFDQALERINAQVGEYIKLHCVGPLPPYSFVDLRL